MSETGAGDEHDALAQIKLKLQAVYKMEMGGDWKVRRQTLRECIDAFDPAVAAALRAQSTERRIIVAPPKDEVDRLRQETQQHLLDEINRLEGELRAQADREAVWMRENDRLVKQSAEWFKKWEAQAEAHKAEVERLNNALLLCQGELELAFKKYDEARAELAAARATIKGAQG